MTDKPNDGGPAFPYQDEAFWTHGMSLRDYFAGQALVGVLAASANPSAAHGVWGPKEWSTYAYDFADAMLEARKR